jgi:hypothetical protein
MNVVDATSNRRRAAPRIGTDHGTAKNIEALAIVHGRISSLGRPNIESNVKQYYASPANEFWIVSR